MSEVKIVKLIGSTQIGSHFQKILSDFNNDLISEIDVSFPSNSKEPFIALYINKKGTSCKHDKKYLPYLVALNSYSDYFNLSYDESEEFGKLPVLTFNEGLDKEFLNNVLIVNKSFQKVSNYIVSDDNMDNFF